MGERVTDVTALGGALAAHEADLAARVEARGLPLGSRLVQGLIASAASTRVTREGRPGREYASCEEFVLLNGTMWRYQAKPGNVRWGTEQACYQNVYRLVNDTPGRLYVEGYATTGIMPVNHAWVGQPKSGTVLDNTWQPRRLGQSDPRFWEYLGIAFDFLWVMGQVMRMGRYGSIIDNWQADWPLLRGEAFKVAV